MQYGRTVIYVGGEEFIQCKRLLLSDPHDKKFKNVLSIDDAEDIQGHVGQAVKIPPIEEFMGHCSNLQAWAENDYNTRLLHSNLSFPLLKKLCDAGDEKARHVIKHEILDRLNECNLNVTLYLWNEGYVENYLNQQEIGYLFENESTLKTILEIFQCKNSQDRIKMIDFIDQFHDPGLYVIIQNFSIVVSNLTNYETMKLLEIAKSKFSEGDF